MTAEKKVTPLSQAHKHFCEEYLIDWNATRAYKSIYGTKSEAAASTRSSKLVRKANVQAYIAKRVEERNLELRVDQAYVINKAKEIVECDYTGVVVMTEREIDELPEATRKLIQSVKIKKRTTSRTNNNNNFDEETEELTYMVTFMSKDKAHECLAKHTNAYAKDNESSLNLNIKGFAAVVAELEID